MPARPSAVRRFGPLAIVVVAVLVVAVIASVKGKPDDETIAAGEPGAQRAVDDPTLNPDLPKTIREMEREEGAEDIDWGERCDKGTGRLRIPSVYSPPCVAVFTGDNGGETHPGVTEDTIKVVAYRAPPGNDLFAALQGVLDDEDTQHRTRVKYVEMLNALYETYGRKIDIEVFVGSGAADDEGRAVADARQIANEIKPFAVLNGPALTGAFATELAKRGIICIGCGVSVPDSVYQENAPHMWGNLPTPEQFLFNFGDFTVRRLLGRKAEFAGDPEMRDKERVFGTINFEQDPPVFSEVTEETLRRGKLRGFESKVREKYILDVPRLPEFAATIISRMKSEGVTTIIFLGDPVMPANLTQAATREDYFPEWVIAGTALTDTTALGRTYAPEQWTNAFGLSNLAGRRPIEQQEQQRLYRWYYDEAPEAQNTSGIIYPPVFLLMLGIHMAGPKLTPRTFQGGLFKYPPSGGGPTTPQISFGNRGLFPEPDYLMIDDATEIWWDANEEGPDEQGRSNSPGMWRYGNSGTRILPGRMPSGPPARHDPDTSPTLFTDEPFEDTFPEYPPPTWGN
jgi:hypothetical protein